MSLMTIISTAPEEITPLDKAKDLDLELKSFLQLLTPFWFQHIDWEEVRVRCRGGPNNVGLVLAGRRKDHDLGVWLAELWNTGGR